MGRKILLTLFVLHIFFMFYNLEKWGNFGWDQVDNAWAAMRIVAEHKYPLVGMVAKGNTGIYIGPFYYYLVALVYFFTRLDPIASPILAGLTSIFSFWVIYFVAKKLFNRSVALISLTIYTFSSFVIAGERVQWPVNFIAPLSLLIFYFLYQVITGKTKYFLHLAAAVGVSFHIHFTAIFYPIIILCVTPWFPKKTWRYAVPAFLLFVIFFIPQIIYYAQNNQGHALTAYFQTSYHGFHLRRVLQLTPDAFIKFQSLLMNPYSFVGYISFLFVPLFVVLQKNKLAFLTTLWFLVPWFIFATYSGEISDYYFSLQTYLVIIILAYFTARAPKILVAAFWIYWMVANVQVYFQTREGNLAKDRAAALEASKTARIINFTEGDPQSYLYYFYMYRKGEWLPYKL